MKPPRSSPLWPLCSRTIWHPHNSVLCIFAPRNVSSWRGIASATHFFFPLIFSQFVFCKSVEDFGILGSRILICHSCACAGSCRWAKNVYFPQTFRSHPQTLIWARLFPFSIFNQSPSSCNEAYTLHSPADPKKLQMYQITRIKYLWTSASFLAGSLKTQPDTNMNAKTLNSSRNVVWHFLGFWGIFESGCYVCASQTSHAFLWDRSTFEGALCNAVVDRVESGCTKAVKVSQSTVPLLTALQAEIQLNNALPPHEGLREEIFTRFLRLFF